MSEFDMQNINNEGTNDGGDFSPADEKHCSSEEHVKELKNEESSPVNPEAEKVAEPVNCAEKSQMTLEKPESNANENQKSSASDSVFEQQDFRNTSQQPASNQSAAQQGFYQSQVQQPYQYQHQQPYQNQHQQQNKPYNQSQGYYRPQTNEYVFAPQPPKKKKNIGKGILIAVVCLLSVFVVSIASISAFKFFTYEPHDSLRSKVPIEDHQFTNKAEEQEVIDTEDVSDSEKDVEAEADVSDETNAAGESDKQVSTNRTKLREFPSIEQLAAPDDAMSIPDIYDKVSPSVVGISATVSLGTQLGTGFIISEDGYIITNAHVIEGYTAVKVVDSDLNEYDAEVIGSDEQTDIAVLRIDPSNFDITPVELGVSSDLRIGELAIAIGNPLGFDLYGTMTTGIISGLNRTVTIEDNSMTLMQTSAAINSGNSGGPLIDAYGRVIGITSAKIDSMYGESLGFAIPIDEAMPIVKNLIEYGYVLGRPSLGITGMDITKMISLFYNLPQGVQVTYVDEGSGAEKAGIIAGDIIIGIEGETITNMKELNEIKKQHSVGDTITLTIYRPEKSEWGNSSGRSFDVDVILKEASPAPQG